MSRKGKIRTLRFGCIGCGSMGRLHVRNSKFVPGMEVVAFADLQEERAKQFLDAFGGEYATADPRRIIEDASIDGVLIQTGQAAHPTLGIAAAETGKHIFMEKPVAADYASALKLVAAVRASGVKYIVGLCNRLAPLVQRAKRICPHPNISFCQCTDTISAQACHNLDLAVHQFHSAPLQTVFASGGNYHHCDPQYADVDCFCAVLSFADGSVHNYIQHGLARNPVLRKYHYQLFGDAGVCVYLAERFKKLHYCLDGQIVHSMTYEGPDFSPPEVAPGADVRGPYGYMGHYEELAALCDAVRNDTEPPMTAEQGAHVLAVELAILESVRTGRVIEMENFCRKLSQQEA
jgi:predicted dehydrogenase